MINNATRIVLDIKAMLSMTDARKSSIYLSKTDFFFFFLSHSNHFVDVLHNCAIEDYKSYSMTSCK